MNHQRNEWCDKQFPVILYALCIFFLILYTLDLDSGFVTGLFICLFLGIL